MSQRREAKRLLRCGLKNYTPKADLQSQLTEAHVGGRIQSALNVLAMSLDRDHSIFIWTQRLIRAIAWRELRGTR